MTQAEPRSTAERGEMLESGARSEDDSLTATIAIRAVALLLAVAAIALLLMAMVLMTWMSGPILNVSAPGNAALFLVLIFVVDAALWACAIGLLRRRPWAWMGAVVLAFLGFGAFLLSRLPGPWGLVGLAVSFGALVALFLPATRRRFGR